MRRHSTSPACCATTRTARSTTKPALSAYTKGVLALEGCRKKGSVATRCIR